MATEVIGFHYKLTDSTGQILDSSEGKEPLLFLVGEGGIIPGLEKVLVTLKVGDKKKVIVPPAEGYGERNEELIVKVTKDQLPEGDVQMGTTFKAKTNSGDQGHDYTVTEIGDPHITLDANHPLAGVELTFFVEIVERRVASHEELEHGHAHSPGSHHH